MFTPRTPNTPRNPFHRDSRVSRNRIARENFKCHIESLLHDGRQLADPKMDSKDTNRSVLVRLLENRIENRLGYREFMHSAWSKARTHGRQSSSPHQDLSPKSTGIPLPYRP
jgi:hypothetical protein